MDNSEIRGVKGFGKALVIITGASKGFGRTLSKEIIVYLKPGSVIILAARSADKLQELQLHISACKSRFIVRCVAADLGFQEGVERVITEVRETSRTDMDNLLLFNNAASLGDVSSFFRDFRNMNEVQSYLSFNVSSALCLTAAVLDAVPRRAELKRVIINISSLCAIKPFPSWVLYCTGKAARDMMFRVLAEEEPDLRVLNYAPGPLDTDMQLQARSSSANSNLRETYTGMHTQGHLLKCEESISKLMKVLLDDDYPSGAHLDFYDL